MENFDLYDIAKIGISALLSAMLTSFTTYYFSSRKDRKKSIRENNTNLLDNVYTPIMRIIDHSSSPSDGYDGLSISSARKIINIIDNNINIVDNRLISLYYSFREELEFIGYNNGGHFYLFDENRKFLYHSDHQFNLLKRKLNRPYDAKAFKTRRYFKSALNKLHVNTIQFIGNPRFFFKRKKK